MLVCNLRLFTFHILFSFQTLCEQSKCSPVNSHLPWVGHYHGSSEAPPCEYHYAYKSHHLVYTLVSLLPLSGAVCCPLNPHIVPFGMRCRLVYLQITLKSALGTWRHLVYLRGGRYNTNIFLVMITYCGLFYLQVSWRVISLLTPGAIWCIHFLLPILAFHNEEAEHSKYQRPKQDVYFDEGAQKVAVHEAYDEAQGFPQSVVGESRLFAVCEQTSVQGCRDKRKPSWPSLMTFDNICMRIFVSSVDKSNTTQPGPHLHCPSPQYPAG